MSGYVYVAAPEALLYRKGDDESRMAKIGFTRSHPDKRVKSFQTGCPIPLKLWFYFDGSPEMERAFHCAFEELNAHGEWFFVADKLEDFISQIADEPNTGIFVDRDTVGAAVFDNIFQTVPPHPSVDVDRWLRSAQPHYLSEHFPEEWQEATQ